MIASRTTAAANAMATMGMAPSKNEIHRGLADALKDERAKATAPDQRRDGGKAEILNQHDANARENDRERERQFDLRELLPPRQPHAPRRIDHGRGHLVEPHDGVGHDGQQRIEKERHERRRRANAANAEREGERNGGCEIAERHHQDAEQRDARESSARC